jgi:hypothetical protein
MQHLCERLNFTRESISLNERLKLNSDSKIGRDFQLIQDEITDFFYLINNIAHFHEALANIHKIKFIASNLGDEDISMVDSLAKKFKKLKVNYVKSIQLKEFSKDELLLMSRILSLDYQFTQKNHKNFSINKQNIANKIKEYLQ